VAQQVSLSWSDSRNLARAAQSGGLNTYDSLALQQVASAAWQTSAETRRARETMERVGYVAEDIADGIERLEGALGLRLDEQSRVLQQQSEVLTQIRDAVLTPARTRAAERVGDAARLLERERWDRALAVAEEGIEADPNNAGVFFAAGWALVGLERMDAACKMFEEARDAADGDERSRAARQAARAALAGGDEQLAYSLARDARGLAQSADERAAVDYDLGVYALLSGDAPTASESLEAACRHSSEHCKMALLDHHYDNAPEMRDLAARILTELAERVELRKSDIEGRAARLRGGLPAPPRTTRTFAQLGVGLRPARDWSVLQAKVNEELAWIDTTVPSATQAASLQATLRILDEADRSLADIEGHARELETVIAAHDTAAQRQDELVGKRAAIARVHARWQRLANDTGLVRRSARKLIVWSVVLILVGILVPALLLLGAVGLVATIVALVLNGAAAQVADDRGSSLERIDREIGTL
jgi:tetratricopeptide (TPR) repeat protein